MTDATFKYEQLSLKESNNIYGYELIIGIYSKEEFVTVEQLENTTFMVKAIDSDTSERGILHSIVVTGYTTAVVVYKDFIKRFYN